MVYLYLMIVLSFGLRVEFSKEKRKKKAKTKTIPFESRRLGQLDVYNEFTSSCPFSHGLAMGENVKTRREEETL